MGQYLMASCTVRVFLYSSGTRWSESLQTSLLLDRSPSASPAREDVNLRRRFKWAFDSSEPKPAGGGSVQPANRADPCTPGFHDWKAFRDLQRQESVSFPFVHCSFF
jgi:hypothetical protein